MGAMTCTRRGRLTNLTIITLCIRGSTRMHEPLRVQQCHFPLTVQEDYADYFRRPLLAAGVPGDCDFLTFLVLLSSTAD
jgi:hypothetical protein